MDPKALEEMVVRLAAPGPYHERLKKLEGTWDLVMRTTVDPSQPPRESKSTSVVHAIMDGRYLEEEVTGSLLGMPYHALTLTGYDNVLRKYVTSSIDNQGTGMMTAKGTPSEDGRRIHWAGVTSDPTTGKLSAYRMEMRIADDDHLTYDIYVTPPSGREVEVMSIEYTRRM